MDNPFSIGYSEPAPVDDQPEQAPAEKPKPKSSAKYHDDLIQGSDEWLAQRCGLITASEMKLILTPTLKVADNDKTRAHVYELLFQRLTKFVEPQYVSDAMMRGQEDEIYARAAYEEHYAPVEQVGFITNERRHR